MGRGACGTPKGKATAMTAQPQARWTGKEIMGAGVCRPCAEPQTRNVVATTANLTLRTAAPPRPPRVSRERTNEAELDLGSAWRSDEPVEDFEKNTRILASACRTNQGKWETSRTASSAPEPVHGCHDFGGGFHTFRASNGWLSASVARRSTTPG